MAITITPEQPDSAEAVALIQELDVHLTPLYPTESRHGFSVEKLLAESVAFFVLRSDQIPAGCGGVKLVGTDYGEIKRMYVRPQFRGLGFGRLILDHLVAYSRDQGVSRLRLETGIHQTEAIALYERLGFARIGPFGPYRPDPLSLFYEKGLG